MTKTDVIEYFRKAANTEKARGIAETARALGITYEAVRKWGEEIPYFRQLHIEKLTNGSLKASQEKAL